MWADGPDHLDHDLVIDFVGGLLPAERRAGVLLHASRCGRCERLLQRAITVRERARASEWERVASEVLTQAAGMAAATVSAARGEAEPRPIWRRFAERWLAPRGAGPLVAAGGLAALLALILLPALADRRALERVHWLPGSEAEVTTRASASLPDSLIRSGLEAYAGHDLATARRQLEAAHGRGQIELVRRLYLANILARQGDHPEAIALLESVPFRLVPEPWSGESRWTLAASLRASGDRRRADSLVEAISQEPGPVGDRARALLHRR